MQIQQDWPDLARVALTVLASPVASSFSERIFSSTGLSSSGMRSSVGQDTLEAMMMSRFNDSFEKALEPELEKIRELPYVKEARERFMELSLNDQ